MKNQESIAQRDDRLYKATLAQRRSENKIALAYASGEAQPSKPDWAEVHDSYLYQGHPARSAEQASTPEQHTVASTYHQQRSKALNPSGTAATMASKAHDVAALAHGQAAKSGEAGDSMVARQATFSACNAEYGETGAVMPEAGTTP